MSSHTLITIRDVSLTYPGRNLFRNLSLTLTGGHVVVLAGPNGSGKSTLVQLIVSHSTGDVTDGGLLWSYPVERHCCSTPAIHDGLAYVADCAGNVHCVDADTGSPYWVHDAGSEIWASTLVADGKIFIGTRRGDFWVLAARRDKQVLSSIRLDDAVISAAVAANGTLYVGTMGRLYAVSY